LRFSHISFGIVASPVRFLLSTVIATLTTRATLVFKLRAKLYLAISYHIEIRSSTLDVILNVCEVSHRQHTCFISGPPLAHLAGNPKRHASSCMHLSIHHSGQVILLFRTIHYLFPLRKFRDHMPGMSGGHSRALQDRLLHEIVAASPVTTVVVKVSPVL